MEGTVVEAIVAAAKEPSVQKVGGQETLSLPPGWHNVVPSQERVTALGVGTLSGVKDYIASNVDGHEGGKLMLHVAPSCVEVTAAMDYDAANRRFFRPVFVVAQPKGVGGFRFGEYFDIETFVILLQGNFVQTPNRDLLQATVSSVTESSVRTNADDGVTQEVTARKGIALAERAKLPNPIRLTPYRTFPEVDQPESPFILRARPCNGGLPQFGLFETDGGRWAVDAAEAISVWLKSNVPGIAVIR
jgi:hypothetical protein